MKLYLIIEERGVGYHKEEHEMTYSTQCNVLSRAAYIMSGSEEDTILKEIYEIDTTYHTMKRMEVVLRSNRMVLEYEVTPV